MSENRELASVLRQLPLITCSLIGIYVITFLAECTLGFDPGSSILRVTTQALVLMGGSSWRLTVVNQEWYRLISAPFLHLDILHLLLNCVALYWAAAPIERLIGRARLIASYVVVALGASIASLILNASYYLSIGASGAIMGLFAAGLLWSYRMSPEVDRTRFRRVAVIMLVAGLAPPILPQEMSKLVGSMDFAAHWGGALSGAVLGVVTVISWRRRSKMAEGSLSNQA
jgi:rhomboid protease GluP